MQTVLSLNYAASNFYFRYPRLLTMFSEARVTEKIQTARGTAGTVFMGEEEEVFLV